MAAISKGSEQESPPDKSEQENKVETKAALARAKAEEKARLKAEKAMSEAQDALKVAEAVIEQERQMRIEAEHARAEAEKALVEAMKASQKQKEAEKALSEAQAALDAAEAEVEQERRIRTEAEQARVEAEKSLAEAMETTQKQNEAEKTELSPIELENGGKEQRVTFIVRLTVDERGKAKRTEIEHPHNGKKEVFPSLDVQRLTAFMKACIVPIVIPEHIASPAHLQARAAAPTPEAPSSTTSLIVSEVEVYRIGAPGIATFILNPDERFVIQTTFRLEGLEAQSLIAQESPFEMRVHIQDIVKRTSRLLKIHSAKLVKDVYEYTPQIEVQGLSPGRYLLLTLIMFPDHKIMAHYDGPVVHIAGVKPSVNLAVPMEAPIS